MKIQSLYKMIIYKRLLLCIRVHAFRSSVNTPKNVD